MKVGNKAPNFKILNENGRSVNIKDFNGRKTVLYFYCKDSTSGCTIESKDFAKNYDKFKKKNAEVVGVCIGTLESHKKFKDDLKLPFNLLVDEDAKVSKRYGVWNEKNFLGNKYMGIERTTFIINEDGRIEKIFPKVKVVGHWKEVLNSIKH
ncbi:MAG: thioredoxin-dependent thiol peroxidase [Candidatus Aenigmarchaeota archaeon]|nr:thioredoxin-dependent thiol peroxidase [Candidatus Aenigmarchaeota archaeon]